MRNLSTLAVAAYGGVWDAVVADTDADDAVYALRCEVHGELARLTIARLDAHGCEELAALAVVAPPPGVPRAIADFRLLADGGTATSSAPALCVVTTGGDIVVLPVGADAPALPADIVGSVDRGILAAAWSPDEDVLVLVTAPADASQLLLMSRDYTVLHETRLATAAFGDDAPINVGWGSKATQFHGSEGKQAAMAAAAAPAPGDPRGPLVPDDDGLARIAWRADGSFFVVSAVEAHTDGTRHRILRIYTRSGSLSATSDASVRGISHVLAVRPVGNVIATTQRMGAPWAPGRSGRHDVVFFERNGLRHNEFSLREEAGAAPDEAAPLPPWATEHAVRALAWNADGSVLAVHLARGTSDVLQLWTTGNYYWYLKQELLFEGLRAFSWHTEQPLWLYVAHTRVERFIFFRETAAACALPPHDAASVGVVDGHVLRTTSFRLSQVPPPMCGLALTDAGPAGRSVPATPRHTAWASTHATELVALLYDSEVHVWRIEHGDLGAPRTAPRAPSQGHAIAVYSVARGATQVAVAAADGGREAHVAVLVPAAAAAAPHDRLDVIAAESVCVSHVLAAPGPWRVVGVPGRCAFALHGAAAAGGGSVDLVERTPDGALRVAPLAPLDAFCPTLLMHVADGACVPVGLADDGRLLVPGAQLARDATSFTLTDRLVVWTTHAHEARFLPLGALAAGAAPAVAELGRRVERGSRIVTAVPSAMALVLQMPRGNLETIYPRAMVLDVVRARLDRGAYGDALRVCRAHRVDLNLLHDHNPATFFRDVDALVAQIGYADHVNLLLSSLRDEDVTATLYRPWDRATAPALDVRGKVNRVCHALLDVLRRDEPRYLTSILTAHVRQVPPDLEGGLRVLLPYVARDMAAAEDACRYLIFLVDAEALYRVALGMYDFTLALLIAQNSPRDPREYVPFLRDLRATTPLALQHYRIDDYLGRHARALRSLVEAEHMDDALAYMEQHRLYREGIAALAAAPAQQREAYARFGAYLASRQRPAEAATTYELAACWDDAVRAHVAAGQWREALTLALRERYAPDTVARLAHELAEQLEAHGQLADAARVHLEQLRDVEQGVALLCRAGALVEARHAGACAARWDLLETHIAPAALDAHAALLDEADEIDEQLTKQLARLAELAVRRDEQPAAFFDEDTALADVDVQSDVSQMTQFTRYTAATSVAATLSTLSLGPASQKPAGKSRAKARKEERKKNAGRKGSVYEEAYLHESLRKLLETRLAALQRRTAQLLPVLAPLGGERAPRAAQALQTRLLALESHAARGADELRERTVALEEQRAELEQALAAQVAQVAQLPGAGDAAGEALATLWRWRHAARTPAHAPPTVAHEPWKLHVLSDEL